jgi:hypothetical protein
MQSIEKITKKIKDLLGYAWIDEIFWALIIICIASTSFVLGTMYQKNQFLKNNPVTVSFDSGAVELWKAYQSGKSSAKNYFASKNGTVVYPAGCNAGNRVNEKNKIFFESIDEAVNLGYRESEQC